MPTPPPGPKGEQLGRLNSEFCRADIFGFLNALTEHYGDIVGFDLGRLPCIFVNGARHVHDLFSQREACLRKPEFVKDSNRGHWGDGLTTLEGSAWRARRRILSPCFRTDFVQRCLTIIARYTEDMLDSWFPGSEPDLTKEFRVLTARIAVRTVLDADLEGHEATSERSAVIPFAEAYGESYVGEPGGDATAPLVIIRPRAPRRMDTTIRVIDERIANSEDRGDVLSYLVLAGIHDGRRLTREEIVGEVMQMLYAGHHTIPSSLVTFWRDIANCDTCGRIAAEADHLCTTGVPKLGSISGSYCLAALKESMRLHPAAPILYREVEREFELNGFEFQRGAAVWVSPHCLHNHPGDFPEPHRFIPERFLNENLGVPGRLQYFPFGAGRRVCIANHLALHQMALTVLLMARRFQFISNQDDTNTFRTRIQARAGQR